MIRLRAGFDCENGCRKKKTWNQKHVHDFDLLYRLYNNKCSDTGTRSFKTYTIATYNNSIVSSQWNCPINSPFFFCYTKQTGSGNALLLKGKRPFRHNEFSSGNSGIFLTELLFRTVLAVVVLLSGSRNLDKLPARCDTVGERCCHDLCAAQVLHSAQVAEQRCSVERRMLAQQTTTNAFFRFGGFDELFYFWSSKWWFFMSDYKFLSVGYKFSYESIEIILIGEAKFKWSQKLNQTIWYFPTTALVWFY